MNGTSTPTPLSWSDKRPRCSAPTPRMSATGKSYAQHVAADGASRFDAVTKSGKRDEGDGVPYQVQYSFRSSKGDDALARRHRPLVRGANGEPARAVGVIRNITERHEREQTLIRRAQFDPLTGEINRLRLVELLETTLEDAERFRTSCGFLLVAIDNLGRLNQAYGYTVVDE